MTTQVGVIEPFGSWVSTTLSRRVATLARTMPHRPAVPIASRLALGLILAVIASSPSAQTGVAAATEPAESSQGARFDVLEFEVDGNTVLPVEAVERAITPYLGLGKAFADVEAARAALEKTYQDAGYVTVFVDLPEQEVSQGVVRLRVLEGQISRLKVTEAKYHDPGLIRDRVSELAPGKVPNFNVAQAQLADLNRTEDRRVQPILSPGPVPGTVEAELKVSDKLPLSFTVELNNRQVQFTDPLRLQVMGRYGNLFQEDHTLSFIGIVTPQDPKQSKAFGLNYLIPLPEGSSWQASLLVSDSSVQPLGGTNVVGKGFNVALKRTWGLPAGQGFYHGLTIGLEYKNTRERINAGADGSTLSSPLRYAPLFVDYSATWVRGEQVSTLTAGGTFAQRRVARRNVECFGQEDQFGCKREEGDGSFAAFRVDATHTHPLPAGLSARWRLGAQFANQPLVGAEQFSVGGFDTVRGYYEAEILGDSGSHLGLEVSGPNWGGGSDGSWRGAFTELQAYGFAEAGRISTQNASDGSPTQVAGAGLGLRLRMPSSLAASVDVAWPLKTTTATQKGHPRVHARLIHEF